MLFRLFRTRPVLYSFDHPVMTYQREYSTASRNYKTLDKDFIGHLDFAHSSGLWESICLYELYSEGEHLYHNQIRERYPSIKKKFMLRLAYAIAIRIKKRISL